jgi:hypothetical protein
MNQWKRYENIFSVEGLNILFTSKSNTIYCMSQKKLNQCMSCIDKIRNNKSQKRQIILIAKYLLFLLNYVKHLYKLIWQKYIIIISRSYLYNVPCTSFKSLSGAQFFVILIYILTEFHTRIHRQSDTDIIS